MDLSSSKRLAENEWIRRAQGGDREAFGQLVVAYQRRVFALVFRLLRRPDEVEDIAQEVFLKVFRSIGTYDARSSFATWLCRVAVNHCYDYLRRVRASRVVPITPLSEAALHQPGTAQPTGGGDHRAVEREVIARDLVSKLLERAPADDRVILTLKEIEELSVAEIAEILGLRPGTVKVRLHRARKRMLGDLKFLQQER